MFKFFTKVKVFSTFFSPNLLILFQSDCPIPVVTVLFLFLALSPAFPPSLLFLGWFSFSLQGFFFVLRNYIFNIFLFESCLSLCGRRTGGISKGRHPPPNPPDSFTSNPTNIASKKPLTNLSHIWAYMQYASPSIFRRLFNEPRGIRLSPGGLLRDAIC